MCEPDGPPVPRYDRCGRGRLEDPLDQISTGAARLSACTVLHNSGWDRARWFHRASGAHCEAGNAVAGPAPARPGGGGRKALYGPFRVPAGGGSAGGTETGQRSYLYTLPKIPPEHSVATPLREELRYREYQ